MLYDEFIENTGCRETPYNYQVYKRLEIIYMNDDTITKAEIYEWGKKLVDNSLTPDQLAWNRDLQEKIDELKEEIEALKADVERYEANKRWSKENGWDDVKFWIREIKWAKVQIRNRRQAIRNYKECFYV